MTEFISKLIEPARTKTVERRAKQRWNLTVPLQVFHQDSQSPLGYAVNISISGMLVIGGQTFAVDQQVSLWLELPARNGSWKKIPLDVIAVHCDKDMSAGTFNTGFAFVDVPPEVLFGLQQLIDSTASFG